MKIRIDQWLVESGLAESRTQAQDLIFNNQVILYKDGKKSAITKANQTFLKADLQIKIKIEILSGDIGKYVSRAGLKLEGALEKILLNVQGQSALDVGVSTGGFSDVLLSRGVSQVIGIDVGHDQTHEKIKTNSRFKLFEGVNAKELSCRSDITQNFPVNGFDLIVVDVSFIRLELIWPEIVPFLKKGAKLLSLIKPQFELGLDTLNKKGIVKDEQLYASLQQSLELFAQKIGLQKLDYFESSIQGKDGNREFFYYGEK